jgi:hypothetical protein
MSFARNSFSAVLTLLLYLLGIIMYLWVLHVFIHFSSLSYCKTDCNLVKQLCKNSVVLSELWRMTSYLDTYHTEDSITVFFHNVSEFKWVVGTYNKLVSLCQSCWRYPPYRSGCQSCVAIRQNQNFQGSGSWDLVRAPGLFCRTRSQTLWFGGKHCTTVHRWETKNIVVQYFSISYLPSVHTFLEGWLNLWLVIQAVD